jgi:hypothetical protein
VKKATRFNSSGCGLTNAINTGLTGLWLIEGYPGLWQYRDGVSHVRAAAHEDSDTRVVADVKGATALFERSMVLESRLKTAMGIEE